jgi:hypothetical protein
LDGTVLYPRMAALSEQLIEVHQGLRERLAALRREVAAGSAVGAGPRSGSEPGSRSGSGPGSGSGDLLSHCLSFCTAIHTHHRAEDDELFPALRDTAPELTPIIDKLAEDHVLVAGIGQRIRDLLASAADPDTLGRELDGLTAILESHFSFEERRIAAALDRLDPAGPGPAGRFPGVFTLAPEP